MSPQLLAMLQAMQSAGGGVPGATPNGGMAPMGGGMPPGGGLPSPGMAGPMSQYIGNPQQTPMMPHPAMAPVAGNPPPGAQQPNTAGLMQMLAQMKGGQTGVQPTGSPAAGMAQQLPAGQNPMAGANPGFLQMLLQHLQGGGAAGVPQTGAGGMT